MLSNLRILHPPCSDNPSDLSVLLLCVDAQRYLFNVPEGTIRSLIQQGCTTHLKATANVFLPRVGNKECGGLPGLVMSMTDVGCRDLTIHSPPVMTHYLATCRAYLRRDSIKVQVNEAPLSNVTNASQETSSSSKDIRVMYQDDHITVKAIPLLPIGYIFPQDAAINSSDRPLKRRKSEEFSYQPTLESLTYVDVMFPNDAEKPAFEMDEKEAEEIASRDVVMRQKLKARNTANFQTLGPPPLQPVSFSDGDKTTEQGPVLVYIVRGKDIEGKVDIEKACSLGVPIGRLLGNLKKGEDIEISRPVAWESYNAEEKSTWCSYYLRSTTPPYDSSKGRAPPKKKAASDPEQDRYLSTLETEKITIKSSDVVGESRAGFLFVQIYLPSIHYLDSFLAASTQSQFQFQFSASQPHTIVHNVHSEILRDQRYKDFIERLKHTQHIIVSRPFLPNRLAFPSSALANLRMGLLDGDLFPPPNYSLETDLKLADIGLKGKNVHLARLDTNIPLYPPGPPILNDEKVLNLDSPLDSKKATRLVTFKDVHGRKPVSEKAKERREAGWMAYMNQVEMLQRTRMNGKATSKDNWPLKLTTLGTGSAQPNKHRNVSGALIHMPGKDAGYILLDAGESTYSQIVRKFGQKGADDVVANIRLIFLSHIHGDHHMGATRLLVERAKLNAKRPLFVIAPLFVRKYLEEVNMIQYLGISEDVATNGVILMKSELLDSRTGVVSDVEAYPRHDVEMEEDGVEAESIVRSGDKMSITSPNMNRSRTSERQNMLAYRKHLTQLLHGTEVFTAEVDHRVSHCYGIVFRGEEWSGAYSGDTRPCNNLVKAGKGVEFLLHEATIEDGLEEMAHQKGHSTFGQAIDIGKQMGVKYVILTHFSQRYAKMPRLDIKDDVGDLKIGIGFDLLTMQMSDLDKMMRYRKTLELLYDIDQEEDSASEGGELTKADGSIAKEDESNPTTKKSRGIKEVPMAVDGTLISGEVLPKYQGQKSLKEADKGTIINSNRLFQRKFVKSHEFQYISFELRPIPSKRSIVDTGSPSRLSIAKAIEASLIDLNGVVNGSFNWDLLEVKSIPANNFIRVVVKTPSGHIETLRTSISAGLVIRLDEISFQARYDRTFSALDLVALETDNSQQWFDDIVRQRNQAQDKR